MTKEEALKTYYGYDAFRGGQEAVIDALLSGRDALAIMPTGAGKSICYQVPALIFQGITLVISHQERILEIADEIILLEKGKIKQIGEKEEMFKLLFEEPKCCRKEGGCCERDR